MATLIPTKKVSIIWQDQKGEPIENARVFAKLSTVERYQGYIVPSLYEAVTNSEGIAILNLFPNALGSESSEYEFKILNTKDGKTTTIYGVVPNTDCYLHNIAELTPYERKGAGEVLSTELTNLATNANNSAQKAKEWAVKIEGVEVEAGKYSSKHYATLASSDKTSAETAKNQAIIAKEQAEKEAGKVQTLGDNQVNRIYNQASEEIERVKQEIPQLTEKTKNELEGYVNEAKEAEVNASKWAGLLKNAFLLGVATAGLITDPYDTIQDYGTITTPATIVVDVGELG